MKCFLFSFVFVFVPCKFLACSRNARETRTEVAGGLRTRSPDETKSPGETGKKNEHEVPYNRENQTSAAPNWNVEQTFAGHSASEKASPPLLLNDDEWWVLWDTRRTETYTPAIWRQSGEILRVKRVSDKIAILHGKQTAFICDAEPAWQLVDARTNGKELDLRCRSLEENTSCGALLRWDGHKLVPIISGWSAGVHDGDTKSMDTYEDEE